jgi:hypothetical protein
MLKLSLGSSLAFLGALALASSACLADDVDDIDESRTTITCHDTDRGVECTDSDSDRGPKGEPICTVEVECETHCKETDDGEKCIDVCTGGSQCEKVCDESGCERVCSEPEDCHRPDDGDGDHDKEPHPDDGDGDHDKEPHPDDGDKN